MVELLFYLKIDNLGDVRISVTNKDQLKQLNYKSSFDKKNFPHQFGLGRAVG